MSSIPEIGQLVQVRNRAFVVTEVQPQSLPVEATQPTQPPMHRVKLSSVEDDAFGEEAELLWELEPGAQVRERAATLPQPTGFDPPEVLTAFLNAVRWGAISQADEKTLQSPFRSGIEIDDYQLDPVVRALTMPRVNLLIADDVGLGKTIEAGLVVQELLLRRRARTVLIVCPSSLQIQWQEEMRDKFGLEFRIIDSAALGQLRRKRGLHVNPWQHFPRLITSIDFLKRERPLRRFQELLPAGGQTTYPRPFDLLIVDEAHNVAPSGRGQYATDSQRTTAIRTLAPHFEHKLFLSATPHNGYRESFAALLELLDHQRFARAVTPSREQLGAVMVRRMKSELQKHWDGSPRFAVRRVEPLEVPYTEAERRAHRALQEYTRLRLQNAKTTTEQFAAEFVLKLLKKRLFSSPAAFATTLQKHRTSVGHAAPGFADSASWRRQIEQTDEDYADDEDYETSTAEAVNLAGEALTALSAEENALLDTLNGYAEQARHGADVKAQTLITWLEQRLRPGGSWNRERVILFTEYRATQNWLHDLLAQHGFAAQGRLLMIYGGMPHEEREKIKAAFQADPDEAPVRILLATDAASEGLNLQNYCCRLIHYEIPWNPNRMEQRNGRVDRHGQKAPEVFVYHFVAKGFQQAAMGRQVGALEADLEFLMRAALKVETIREDLGKVGPVIARQVEEAMLGQRRGLDTAQAERDAEPVRRMLKFERQLRDQLKKLMDQLQATQEQLQLTPENVRDVVQIGLRLAGQPPLIETDVAGIPPQKGWVFQVPALTGSWAACTAGLAHPHTGHRRPVVFDATLTTGRDDVVLAHLNHRLVQMCLRLLRAEVWALGGRQTLYRVSAQRLRSGTRWRNPLVIAHGRIVVLGGDHHRLHEEVIMAGGEIREGRFARFKTLDEMQQAWAAATDETAPEGTRQRLAALWPQHGEPLLKALEARMGERTRNLETTLTARADQEVARFTAVLTELQRAIERELNTEAPVQLELWSADEKAQRERDEQGLRRRLAEIPQELRRETDHLRARFRDPSPRLFPLAVTYLVPPTAWAGS